MKSKAASKELAKVLEEEMSNLINLATKRLSDYESAKDVVQLTCLKAHKNLKQFEGRSALKSWVFGILKNECLMALRERRFHSLSARAYYNSVEAECLLLNAQDPKCLEEQAHYLSIIKKISETLKSRPLDERIMFIKWALGYSTVDEAKAVSKTIPTLKSQIHRIKMDIQSFLNKEQLHEI